MNRLPDLKNCKISIVGMGYVGLPLAIEININKNCLVTNQKLNRNVIGFDIDLKRITELKNFYDKTNEINKEDLKNNRDILFTNYLEDILDSDIFIVTVPTPIDEKNKPYLNPIKKASQTIGSAINLKNKKTLPIVIFESTVYPGLTEEICIPIIEKEINGKLNENFLCGYSPERINPGDSKRSIKDIIKVTSGATEETANLINKFYRSFIKAGTHKAQSIKTAEMSKIIENTQRDINVALVNEFARICKKLNIDTLEVLEAAGTKWNFLDFKPGLVGGHCIGVDPYYLTYKSQMIGYEPEIVLAGRKINDSMCEWIVKEIILYFENNRKAMKNSSLLIMGLTFKEDCPDIRNSGSLKIAKKLSTLFKSMTILDPNVNKKEIYKFANLKVENEIPKTIKYDFVLISVAHKQFKNMSTKEWELLINNDGKFFDIKGIIPRKLNPIRI